MFKNKIKKSKVFAAVNISFILVIAFLLILACVYAILDRKNPQYNVSNPRFFIVFIAIGLGVCSLGYGIY
jgi:VIT1/CCC1 family predicted Fe2+/Mn2+ transporter